MSVGRCKCPCEKWGHGGVCDGGVRHSLPQAPYLEGFVHQPCCAGCYTAIQAETSRRAIAPKEPGRP